jgi:plastocyanin
MKKVHVITILVAIAGIAAASALTVTQRNDTVNIFAERFTLRDEYEIGESSLAPASADAAALGVDGAPVELTAAMPEARTAISRDHWVYRVPIHEKAAASGARGLLTIRLFVDNVPAATIFAAQDSLDAAAVEGVVARFDIGTSLSTDALYFVEVRPVLQVGPELAFTVRSSPSGDLTWMGVGGAADGVVNPEVVLPVGTTLRLTARNADGNVHNIGLKNAANTLVSPPAWSTNIANAGDAVTISWTPTTAGTYSYLCQFHASMKGVLRVTSA